MITYNEQSIINTKQRDVFGDYVKTQLATLPCKVYWKNKTYKIIDNKIDATRTTISVIFHPDLFPYLETYGADNLVIDISGVDYKIKQMDVVFNIYGKVSHIEAELEKDDGA